VLINPLHSKTASKAGASLWIPLGRAAPPINGKNRFSQTLTDNFPNGNI
jgi:hypothetical protein